MRNRKTSHQCNQAVLLRRAAWFFVGMLFFMFLAAARARGGDFNGYSGNQGGYGGEWTFPDEDEDDVMSADDHRLAMRMKQRMLGPRPVYHREKASKVHDSVTIVIDENTTSEITSSNDLKRDTSNNIVLSSWLTPSLKNGLSMNQKGAEAGGNSPTLAYSGSRAHKSDSTIEREQNFASTLTGEVVEVLPNRHLVVQARKTVAVNGEVQTLLVTGVVNPDHLDSNSSVKADYIMDMNIRYSGSGPMSRMDKRGWGAKIIDFVNPF